MEINSATNNISQSAGANNSTSAAASAIAADFETFLTLLTTQMKNQDPLKPLESTDFIAQLATFSGVEQQVRTNTSLEEIQALLGGSSSAGLANWIGVQVQVLKDPQFDGAPIDVFIAPAAEADRAELVVYNEAGEEVQRLSVPLRTDVLAWAGVDADGEPLANGTYKLELESYLNDELVESHQAPIYDEIKEARLDGSVTLLVLADGSVLLADQVTAIRGK
jgi:flagellar basal-body rod modification protein FlgD